MSRADTQVAFAPSRPPVGLRFRALAFGLALAVTLVAASEARATTFTIYFDGVVDRISPGLVGGSLQRFAPVHGRVVIERDGLVAGYEGPYDGFLYRGPPYPVISFDLSIGDYAVASAIPDPSLYNNDVNYLQVLETPSQDLELFAARTLATGAPVNGQQPVLVQFALFNAPSVTGLDLIHGPAIPSLSDFMSWAQVLADLDTNYLTFYPPILNQTPGDRIDWDLTRIEVVPEPGIAWFFAAALLTIGLCRAMSAPGNCPT